MTLDGFLRAREPDWQRLDDALRRARGRPDRLGAAGALELGALYRSAAADLAIARRRFPGESVIRRLEVLVGDGRQAVYGRRSRRRSLPGLIATGYWREVRRRPGALAVAWIALIGPALLAGAWALADPGAAIGLVPQAYRGVAGTTVHHEQLSAASQASLSSEIFTNNIRVSLVAFAGGLTLGVGTLAIVAYNGILLGVLAGLTLENGNFETFVRYVAPHGLLELSCIAVSACAGLRVAWAVIDPGPARDAHVDAIGNCVGRYEGDRPGACAGGGVAARRVARRRRARARDGCLARRCRADRGVPHTAGRRPGDGASGRLRPGRRLLDARALARAPGAGGRRGRRGRRRAGGLGLRRSRAGESSFVGQRRARAWALRYSRTQRSAIDSTGASITAAPRRFSWTATASRASSTSTAATVS